MSSMRTRKNAKYRKERRHDAAKLREEARAKRTPAEQLSLLDVAFGEGVGAKRERARLNAIVTKEKLVEKFAKNLEQKREARTTKKQLA